MKYLKLSDLRAASWYDVFGAEVEVWWQCHLKERTWCKLTTWLVSPLRVQSKLLWGLTCSQWSTAQLEEFLFLVIDERQLAEIERPVTKASAWSELLWWACSVPPQILFPGPEVDRRLHQALDMMIRFVRRKARKTSERMKKVDFHPIPWQDYLSFMEVPVELTPIRQRYTELGLNPVLAQRATLWFATGHRPRQLQFLPRNHSNTPPSPGYIVKMNIQGHAISPNLSRTSLRAKRPLDTHWTPDQVPGLPGLRFVHKWRNFNAYSRFLALFGAYRRQLAPEGRGQ